MAAVYFDASALVKLLVEEEGTDLVVALWDGCDVALSSRLAYPEVRAALAAAARNGRLDQADLRAVERDWNHYWSSIRMIELSEAVSHRAGDLCRAHALGGADGVHLASALAVDDGDLIMAVWDQRLHAAADAAALRVAPAPRD